MVEHLNKGPRTVVFLIDVASSATAAGVRNGGNIAFRRQVAREHAVMVGSAIERVLCHADNMAADGVCWTFRIFDSRDKNSSTSITDSAFDFIPPSFSSLDDCRKSVQLSFDSSSRKAGFCGSSLDTIGAALQSTYSAVPVINPTVSDKNNYLEHTLIVLLTSASYDHCNFETAPNSNLDIEGKSSLYCSFNEHSVLNAALSKMADTGAKLMWVCSYSRRVDDTSAFNLKSQSLFVRWLLEKRCVDSYTDMHSLLLDRSLVPFSCVARHYSKMYSAVALGRHFPSESSDSWLSMEFVLPSLGGLGDVLGSAKRLLKVELSSNLLNSRNSNGVWAVCEALVKQSLSDYELAALGGFDRAPGLVRPVVGAVRSQSDTHTTLNSLDSKQTWTSAFSGLMMALAHTDHFLLASLYSRDPVSNLSVFHHTIIVQPLTPMCGIVRVISPTSLSKVNIEPLFSPNCKVAGDKNPLRKRVFGGPYELSQDFVDSVGVPSRSSQSARFFEAHLSSCTDVADHVLRTGSHSGSILSGLTKLTSPRSISELLEAHIGSTPTKQLDELGLAITEHHARGVIQDCRSTLSNSDNGDELMAGLVRRLGATTHPSQLESNSKAPNSTTQFELDGFSDEIIHSSPSRATICNVNSNRKETPVKMPDSNGLSFSAVVRQLNAHENQILVADSENVLLHCNNALQTIAQLVELGIRCNFSFTSQKEFGERILKFKQMQKRIYRDLENLDGSGEKLDRVIFTHCILCYEQAVLHLAKEIVRLKENILCRTSSNAESRDRQQHIIKKRLKRVCKILNTALATAVSRDRHITDGNPFHELFDKFFKTILNRFISCGMETASGILGKTVEDEFERSDVPEIQSDIAGACQLATDPYNVSNDVLPMLHKKRGPKEISMCDSRDRKRPRTKDMKLVLAHAATLRSHAVPVRRDSLQGLRNLEFEKGIQRPLHTNCLASPIRRDTSQGTDSILTQFNLGRRRKMTIAVAHNSLENENAIPIGLDRQSFYSEAAPNVSDHVERNQSNPVLVPGTPSDID